MTAGSRPSIAKVIVLPDPLMVWTSKEHTHTPCCQDLMSKMTIVIIKGSLGTGHYLCRRGGGGGGGRKIGGAKATLF